MANSRRPQEDDTTIYRGRGYGRGQGRGRGGRGRGRGRGRPAIIYPIDIDRKVIGDRGIIELSSFEMELLKLSDIKNLKQNEIAEILKISQTSVWRYLSELRKKIAEAISKHDEIIIRIRD